MSEKSLEDLRVEAMRELLAQVKGLAASRDNRALTLANAYAVLASGNPSGYNPTAK